MNYITYISTAIRMMDEQELGNILVTSRDFNALKNITGMLIYGEGVFIQVLEGNLTDIEALLEKIKLDKRHKNLMIILRGEAPERYFPDWSMGFKTINAENLSNLQGYFDPAKKHSSEWEASNTPMVVLRSFVETNRLSL